MQTKSGKINEEISERAMSETGRKILYIQLKVEVIKTHFSTTPQISCLLTIVLASRLGHLLCA